MSIKTTLAATVLVLGATFSLGTSQAAAAGNPACDGTVHYSRRDRGWQCYYLPTVSGGRVTGLQEHDNIVKRPFCRTITIFVAGKPQRKYLCT
jgi:hypothetical protein